MLKKEGMKRKTSTENIEKVKTKKGKDKPHTDSCRITIKS